ncbi:hypothetical protein B0T11DRAFT_297123 [Plectosphaerella cucumerina]|uniref:Uncharacterized protein n=1 Tax=Plectosphaerella cucumerina TaxID=40658 RepID=A0A8K0TFJ4_9PEZI|nr:hypothetical protein B0T11DRAFT_297123 [Plectosphaerella cucumerina]
MATDDKNPPSPRASFLERWLYLQRSHFPRLPRRQKQTFPTPRHQTAKTQGRRAIVWQQAFDSLCEDQPELMSNAEAFLKDQANLPQEGNMHDRLADIATAQKAKFQNKQWKFQWLGKPQVVREKVESVIELANQWASLISAGMSLAPPYVSIPWSAVTALLPMMMNDAQEHKGSIDGLESIARLVLSYQLAEGVFLGRGQEAREAYAKAVLDLYKLVLEYQAKAIEFLGVSTLRRLGRNAMGSSVWKDMPGVIAAKDDEVRRSLNFKAMEDQMAGFSSLKDILQRQEEKIDALIDTSIATTDEVREIMTWVSSIPVETDHADVRLKLGEGHFASGQWFLHDLQVESWMQWEKGCRHLWLRGGMGTGKSSLTSMLIENLFKSPDGVVAIFYCSRKIDEKAQAFMQRNSGVSVIRALLAQSAVSTDGTQVYDGVKRRYNRDKKRALSGFALSAEDCLLLLGEMILNQPGTRFTVAIDALDECEDHDELLEMLQKLAAADNLRFFFSSRFEVRVRSVFPAAKDVTILSQNTADIDRFLDVEISRRRDGCGITDAQVLRLRQILRDRSNGMFLWVKIQVNRFLDPIKSRRTRLESDIALRLQALEDFPAAGEELLKAAYDDEYNRATASGLEPSRATAVVSALRWVLSAFRPLTLKELTYAVSVNHEVDPTPRGASEGDLLEFCSNFILEDTTGIMQLAHLSARHYLEARIPPDFLPGAAHLEAALTSLYFRRTLDYGQHLFQDTQVVQRGDFALTKAFYDYVETYWWSHCQQAHDSNLIGALIDSSYVVAQTDVGHHKHIRQNTDDGSNFVFDLLEILSDTGSIAQNANLVSTDANGNTALHHIIRLRIERGIEALIRGGVSIDAKNGQGNSALHLAAMYGLDEGTRVLLESGAARDCRNNHGQTPLHLSIIFGHLDVFETLFASGADALAQDHHRNTPLHYAAQWECEQAVSLILSDGYNPDGINYDGDNALGIAIKGGQERLIRKLLHSDTPWGESATDTLSLSVGDLVTLTWELCFGPSSPDMPEPVVPWLTGRIINPQPTSRQTSRMLRSWIDDCESSRQQCKSDNTTWRAPTRLIDIGLDDSSPPRLVEFNPDDQVRYVFMWYQWGENWEEDFPKSSYLRLENIDMMKHKIDTMTLPVSISDGLFIVRSAGERYLWVQPLCVAADSFLDWEREDAFMSSL